MPLQHLFTKREQRIIAGRGKESIVEKSAAFWNANGFRVNFTGPYQMHAEHFESRLGLRQTMDLNVSDYNQDVAIDLSLSATLGDTGAVVGVVGLFVVPLAVVAVGGISYIEYGERANQAISNYWSFIYSQDEKGGVQQAVPLKCASCSAPLDADSKFCKSCGAKVE